MRLAAENQSVYVKNAGSSPLVDAYDGVHYIIEPGASVVVPSVAAQLWFGDWSSDDDPRKGITRKGEIERLQVRYGVVNEMGPEARSMDEIWDANKPKVEITTIGGDSIVSVIDDPTGRSVVKHIETVTDRDTLMAAIRQQQSDLDQLKKSLAKENRAAAAGGSDVEEDVVESPPSKRSRTNAVPA